MHMLEGFILDSNVYGESGRILKILTKEYGVVTVVATGVRELHSKMRASMDILQLVVFEFVEGREMNRLTGLHEKEKFNFFNYPEGNPRVIIEKRRVISNVVNFVLRTVVGETSNERLWGNFMEGIRSVSGGIAIPSLDKGGLGVVEIIWLVKILVSLGYWEEGKLDKFDEATFKFLEIEENKKEIVEEINKSIKSTHL